LGVQFNQKSNSRIRPDVLNSDGLSETKECFSQGSASDDHTSGLHIPRPALLLVVVVVVVAASTIVVPVVMAASAAALHDFGRADSVFSVRRYGARVGPRAPTVDTWQRFRSALLGSPRRRVAPAPIRLACSQSRAPERHMRP